MNTDVQEFRKMSLVQMMMWAEVDKLVLVLSAMLVLPLCVHLIPSPASVRLGSILLPIFYAPLLAARRYRWHVAVLAGVLSPMINMWITGHPSGVMTSMLTVELVFFVSLLKLFLKANAKSYFTAPAAYMASKVCSLGIFQLMIAGRSLAFTWNAYASSLERALPGILILLALNLFAVKRESHG